MNKKEIKKGFIYKIRLKFANLSDEQKVTLRHFVQAFLNSS